MTNRWTQILQSLEPEYDNLSKIIEDEPYIEPKLSLMENGNYIVSFDEVWPTIFSFDYSSKLDDRLNWASKELEKWSSVNRSDWNAWRFQHLRDAERFLILYNLKWLP
jgi:hypothetical protein